MNETQVLFGLDFPLEAIADFKLRRGKANDFIMLIALGSQPSWLTVVLHDGRRLEASSRGSGPEHEAINSLAGRVSEWKANEALHALANGMPYAFAPVTLTPEGIQHKGRLTRWDEIAGFNVCQGGLLWDDARGHLAGEVMLANVSFADALYRVIATRLPGKDYERMQPGEGPKAGFFSITARTRIPGTFKYQFHLFFGFVPAVILLFGAYYVQRQVQFYFLARALENEPKPYLGWIDDAAVALRGPGVTTAPACPRETLPYNTYLAASDKSSFSYRGSSGSIWHTGAARELKSKKDFFVWAKEGNTVRVVRWEGATKTALCSSTITIREGGSPEHFAQQAAEGYSDPPAASATTTATAPTPAPTTKPRPRRK